MVDVDVDVVRAVDFAVDWLVSVNLLVTNTVAYIVSKEVVVA